MLAMFGEMLVGVAMTTMLIGSSVVMASAGREAYTGLKPKAIDLERGGTAFVAEPSARRSVLTDHQQRSIRNLLKAFGPNVETSIGGM